MEIRPNLDGLYDPLILSREGVSLGPVKGRFVPFEGSSETISAEPLMKGRPEDTAFGKTMFGTKSGLRSALVEGKSDGNYRKFFFIKGCGLDDGAINLADDHAGQPLGGQLQFSANEEMETTKAFNDMLTAYGFRPVRTPVGRFDYEDFNFGGETCSASIFRTLGDTRLDEMVSYMNAYISLPQNRIRKWELTEGALDFLSKTGAYCGNIMQVIHSNGFLWGTARDKNGKPITNAHIGNFVVFNEGKEGLRITPVDFDGQTSLSMDTKVNRDELALLQTMEIDHLFGSFASGKPISNPGYFAPDSKTGGMPQKFINTFIDSFVVGLRGDIRPEPIDFHATKFLDKLIPRIVNRVPTYDRIIDGIYGSKLGGGYNIDYINNTLRDLNTYQNIGKTGRYNDNKIYSIVDNLVYKRKEDRYSYRRI